MELEISVASGWPSPFDWYGLAESTAQAVALVAPELGHSRLSTSLVLSDDAEVHALNQRWRGKDRPTNVLSFPMLERDCLLHLPAEGPPELLGDIVLALETCKREAIEKGIPLADHAAHLIVHGLLHLAGYDHETSSEDASAMEALETKALACMGIADPYAET